MTIFRYSITLIDKRAEKTTLNFRGDFDALAGLSEDFDAAVTAAGALKSALLAITDANLYKESLTYEIGGGTALPVDADITDELAIVVFLSALAEVPKYATLRVPAPIDAVWESDGKTLDESNAAVQAFVAEFDADAHAGGAFEVSDGEHVETDNANGIHKGFYRSKARSTNPD